MKSGLWHLASCRGVFLWVFCFLGFFLIVPFGLETVVQLKLFRVCLILFAEVSHLSIWCFRMHC